MAELTFCPHCRKQVEDPAGHECPDRPADYAGPEAVTVNLNRRQRRQAMARAKKRIAKEKKS
jgi:hypothetical protein